MAEFPGWTWSSSSDARHQILSHNNTNRLMRAEFTRCVEIAPMAIFCPWNRFGPRLVGG